MKSKTKDMVLCGIFAAVICICSVISLPVGAVPVSLGTFGIMLTSNTLGIKRGFISTAVFVLLGLLGLPVFSGFQGGIGVLAAPTGGFIIGYIFMPLISGIRANRIKQIFLNLGAVLLCYITGALWFMHLTGMGLKTAVAVCIAPFIVFDIIKAIGSAIISLNVKCKM